MDSNKQVRERYTAFMGIYMLPSDRAKIIALQQSLSEDRKVKITISQTVRFLIDAGFASLAGQYE